MGVSVFALVFFFIEGLTLVCIVGTVILWGVFGFLYVTEKKLQKQKQKQKQ